MQISGRAEVAVAKMNLLTYCNSFNLILRKRVVMVKRLYLECIAAPDEDAEEPSRVFFATSLPLVVDGLESVEETIPWWPGPLLCRYCCVPVEGDEGATGDFSDACKLEPHLCICICSCMVS